MKIKVWLNQGGAMDGSDIEREVLDIPEEELEGLTKEERRHYIQEYFLDWIEERLDTGYKIIEK